MKYRKKMFVSRIEQNGTGHEATMLAAESIKNDSATLNLFGLAEQPFVVGQTVWLELHLDEEAEQPAHGKSGK